MEKENREHKDSVSAANPNVWTCSEEDPIKKAIEECIQKGILAEYL